MDIEFSGLRNRIMKTKISQRGLCGNRWNTLLLSSISSLMLAQSLFLNTKQTIGEFNEFFQELCGISWQSRSRYTRKFENLLCLYCKHHCIENLKGLLREIMQPELLIFMLLFLSQSETDEQHIQNVF